VAGYLPALFSLRALYWFAGLWHAGVVLLSVWILAAGRRSARHDRGRKEDRTAT